MGVLSRKVKSRSRAATLLRGVLHQWWQKDITTAAAPVESPNSKTASPLLERCAQFRLELTGTDSDTDPENEGSEATLTTHLTTHQGGKAAH